jgi:hypothetical protein
MTTFDVKFISHNRKAVCQPDPAFPNGRDLDLTRISRSKASCVAEIPYPAECCGAWVVTCEACGLRVAITAAGRPDDPKSAKLPCKKVELSS